MTNLQDLERRLRERHDYLYKGSCIPSCITEAADLIATLRQMGEGLPEPSAFMKHTGGMKFFTGNFEIAQREGYDTSLFTREQMIAYAAQYKLDAERYRWLKTQHIGEWEAAAMSPDPDAAIDHSMKGA